MQYIVNSVMSHLCILEHQNLCIYQFTERLQLLEDFFSQASLSALHHRIQLGDLYPQTFPLCANLKQVTGFSVLFRIFLIVLQHQSWLVKIVCQCRLLSACKSTGTSYYL